MLPSLFVFFMGFDVYWLMASVKHVSRIVPIPQMMDVLLGWRERRLFSWVLEGPSMSLFGPC